jgi:hypothetical protein
MRLKWSDLERDAFRQRLKPYRPFLPAQRQLLIADQLGHLLQLINPQHQLAIEAMYQDLLTFASDRGINLADALLGDTAVFSAVSVEAIAFSATESYNQLLRQATGWQQLFPRYARLNTAYAAPPKSFVPN